MKRSPSNSRLAAFVACFAVAALANAAQTHPTAQTVPPDAARSLEIPATSVPVPTAERAQVIPPHLADAEKLLAELPNATLNVYGEGVANRPFIDWTPTHPAARTVCSTFAALLLEHTYSYTPAQIARWLHSATPNADRIYDAVNENKGFTGFHEIARIQPGDFLVSKFFDDSKDTGHVMLVEKAPVQIDAVAPIIPNTTQYAVTVIDSSASGHGTTDTRRRPDGSFTGGIGRGVFRIYGNPAGQIVGYAWSMSQRSKYYAPPGRRLIVGRLTLRVSRTADSSVGEPKPVAR